jgi:hypothetical protein
LLSSSFAAVPELCTKQGAPPVDLNGQAGLRCRLLRVWLQVPFCIVFTKCDARKKGGPTTAANIKAWKIEWLQQYQEVPACFETSAELGQGRNEVLNYLASLRVLDEEQGEEL